MSSILRKIWHFIWEDNSVWSWLVNIVLAFVLIKFVIYPLLGLALGTNYPIVAVVSGSMEHDGTFEQWWSSQHQWYEDMNITKEEFMKYPFKNGFNKGDLMILVGAKEGKLKKGDILVFKSNRPDPIIHRIVKITKINNEYSYQTKGDHNIASINNNIINEVDIRKDRLLGKAVIRIPYLGWVKIGFVEIINWIF